MLDVETKNSLFEVYSVYSAVIMVPNCGTLQIISSKIIALHGGKACEDYGRLHTIRAT